MTLRKKVVLVLSIWLAVLSIGFGLLVRHWIAYRDECVRVAQAAMREGKRDDSLKWQFRPITFSVADVVFYKQDGEWIRWYVVRTDKYSDGLHGYLNGEGGTMGDSIPQNLEPPMGW